MKTLKINIPDGFRIKSFDEKSGEVNFEVIPKDIKEQIKSLEDVFKLNNTTEDVFNDKWKNHEPHSKAADLEILIVSAYNEGKLPDWEDGTSKYYPRFKMGSPSDVGFSYNDYDNWNTNSNVSSHLCELLK